MEYCEIDPLTEFWGFLLALEVRIQSEGTKAQSGYLEIILEFDQLLGALLHFGHGGRDTKDYHENVLNSTEGNRLLAPILRSAGALIDCREGMAGELMNVTILIARMWYREWISMANYRI